MPEYQYELPTSDKEDWRFTATVVVQPKIDVADWSELEVAAPETEVPPDLVERELEVLRFAVAELAPVAGRPVREGDTVVVDLVGPTGEAQRDYVVEVGAGRIVEEIEAALAGMDAGETREVEYELADGEKAHVAVTVKDVKEKILPDVDDDLARAASEFDTLDELRRDITERLREQVEEEVETYFRSAAADALVEASRVEPTGPLVEARTAELLHGLVRSLERRGISPQTYLAVTSQTADQLQQRLRAEAERAVARELVLEAAADKLGVEISDDELREFVRDSAREAGEEDVEEVVERGWLSGRHEALRDDLRMRRALDRIAADVKRIPLDLARAREKLWTPEKEKGPADTKIWTPSSSKEPV
jgi:trigger factor